MSIILVLIPLSIAFAVAFLAAFIWAVRSGQYEDTCTPSMRLLLDEPIHRDGPPRTAEPREESRAPARRESVILQQAEQELGAPTLRGGARSSTCSESKSNET